MRDVNHQYYRITMCIVFYCAEYQWTCEERERHFETNVFLAVSSLRATGVESLGPSAYSDILMAGESAHHIHSSHCLGGLACLWLGLGLGLGLAHAENGGCFTRQKAPQNPKPKRDFNNLLLHWGGAGAPCQIRLLQEPIARPSVHL